MTARVNPYGDGKAAVRIVRTLLEERDHVALAAKRRRLDP
jgi:hypothetical protein